MAKNKKAALMSSFCSHMGRMSLICAVLLLGACDSQYIPDLPSLSGNSSDVPKKQEMTDETSHMQPPRVIPAAPRDRLNPKNLFGKSLRSDGERLDRLERAVQDMRNEFNSVKPSIKRLMAIEGDIQNLIAELKALSDNPSMAATTPRSARAPQVMKPTPLIPQSTNPAQAKPVSVEPIAAPAPTPVKTINRPPPPSGTSGVYNVRVGEHPGKTRIVLDVGSKKSFTTDIDNSEKIMIVEISDTQWSAATAKSFAKSPYVSSYKVEETGSGYMMIFQLKRAAKIGYQAEIGSVSGKGRRIVIDVTSA